MKLETSRSWNGSAATRANHTGGWLLPFDPPFVTLEVDGLLSLLVYNDVLILLVDLLAAVGARFHLWHHHTSLVS